ncbi:MAG: diguanylate cyclase [bacterium]
MSALSRWNLLVGNKALQIALFSVLTIAIEWSGITHSLDNSIFDALPRAGADSSQNHAPVLIGIDTHSLESMGPWPWSRRVHARLLEILNEAGVRSITFDIHFDDPSQLDPDGDEQFANALNQSGVPVVLAVAPKAGLFKNTISYGEPLPAFRSGNSLLGHTDVEIDSDGIIRAHFLHAGTADKLWPSLALATWQSVNPSTFARFPALSRAVRKSSSTWQRDDLTLPAVKSYRDKIQEVSAHDVLKGNIPYDSLAGRSVIIGVTSPNLVTLYPLSKHNYRDRVSLTEVQTWTLAALLDWNTAMPVPHQYLAAINGIISGSILALILGGIHRTRVRYFVIAIISCLAGTYTLLNVFQLWLPIASVITTLVIAAAVIIWFRIKVLSQQTLTDPLTGIANRRAFEQYLQREWLFAQRTTTTISLLLVDIDHFKHFNDTYGHPQGDSALQAIATALPEATLRPRDLVARIGGEEFAIILPETSLESAELVADRLHKHVHRLCITTTRGVSGCLSLSIGVAACTDTRHQQPENILDEADQALYLAKKAGRNRTMRYTGTLPAATSTTKAKQHSPAT